MRTGISVAMMALAITVGYAGEVAKFTWKEDVTKESIPAESAKGMAHGVNFKVEEASIQNGVLKLRQGKDFFADQEFMIFTFLKEGETLDGMKFTVKQDDGHGAPHIHFKYRLGEKKSRKSEMFMTGYTMKLEFGSASGKKIPGKIYLCLPDKAKSFVVGTFEAELN